jgi:hypothetical protein
MIKKVLLTLLLSTALAFAAGSEQWILQEGTLSYHVSHPLHQIDGVSHAARGKGVCHDGQCDFLIAAPVKSFDSGDSNRDLHMVQATRGAQFPMVSVRTRLPESALNESNVSLDLDVEFAGQTAHYSHIAFQQTVEGTQHRITGTIPARVSDFKIDPPSLLTVPIKNEMPVKVDMVWRPA